MTLIALLLVFWNIFIGGICFIKVFTIEDKDEKIGTMAFTVNSILTILVSIYAIYI